MNGLKKQYDVVVVGAGHAGCEAAIAAAKIGASTLLITGDLSKVASLPCNPSVGGPGKGHLVREIDALGGVMGQVVDASAIQLKELNTSKGPAVRAYRAQLDRTLYNENMSALLRKTKNLDLLEDEVTGVVEKNQSIRAVTTKHTGTVNTSSAIICSGTFLNGEIVLGPRVVKKGGRMDAPASHALAASLKALGIKSGRLKTGTPPRIARDSIDYSKLEKAPGTAGNISFSHPDREIIPLEKQDLCWLTYTNSKTHQLILENYHLSGNTSGLISEVGPRSCPSLDLKVRNFPDKQRHPIFIEPVGSSGTPDGERMYLQGCSTAFSEEFQEKIFKTIVGLENAKFLEYGYAVRYDYFLPHQLGLDMQSKHTSGLYFAGQLNGTTGYEEAAAQGLLAGINAALRASGKPAFVLSRTEAYIGVLIEDLVTKTHAEPYRMFTSRAEYRLLLRNDNADIRLTHKGFEIGLQTLARKNAVEHKINDISESIQTLKNSKIKTPNSSMSAFDWLKRPENKLKDLAKQHGITIDTNYRYNVEVESKYSGYFEREEAQAEKLLQKQQQVLPENLNYQAMQGLRNEAKKRLTEIQPQTLAAASNVAGITPADLSILLVYLRRQSHAITT